MHRNRYFRTACTAVLAGLVLSACSPADPFAQTSTALADGVLLPAYSQWAESDRRLAASARAFCADNQALEEARQHFFDAQQAWAGLQPLLIGPLGEGNRAWQVQFWPDKKNLVGRQVTALLKSKPALTQADLEGASVVVQGLTAYEYVLFDRGIDLQKKTVKAQYCPLLIAIGEHQQVLSANILQQWQGDEGMAAQLKLFPNARYAEPAEAVAELLRIQVTALDSLKKKLGTPLGRQSKGHPQPYQAEAWRSEASLASLASAVAGAEKLWQGDQGNGIRQLLGASHDELAKRIDAAYGTVLQHLAELQQPLGQLLHDASGRSALATLYDSLDALHRLHQGDLAQALGIQIGFNAHDGD